MKNDKSILTKVLLGIAAIAVLWIVTDTYSRTTSASRETDKAKERIENNLRELDAATQKRLEREKSGGSGQ